MKKFPTCPDEISPEWLERALAAPAGSLVAVAASPVGTGQVAASHRLALAWRGHAGPASIVAKCPSVDATSRNTGAQWGLYAREAEWYQQLVRHSSVRCPACYYADIEEPGAQFILLLEDCAPATQGDQFEGVSLSAIRDILKEAAKLHGPFMGHEILNEAAFVKIEEENRPKYAALYDMVWPLFRERYATRLDGAFLALGDDFAKRYAAFIDHEAETKTLCHGDFRVDNMLFGGADGRVVILDWQTLGTGNPMGDVAYLLGTSMADISERRQEERALVEYYYALLREQGLDIDGDTLWKEYRLRALSGFLTAVISAIIVERTERGDELFAVMAERSGQQAIDHNSLSLL